MRKMRTSQSFLDRNSQVPEQVSDATFTSISHGEHGIYNPLSVSVTAHGIVIVGNSVISVHPRSGESVKRSVLSNVKPKTCSAGYEFISIIYTDGMLEIWQITSNSLIKIKTYQGDYIASSWDNDRCAAATKRKVNLFDFSTQENQNLPIIGATCVDIAGDKIVVGRDEGTISLWDHDHEISTIQNMEPVKSIAFIRDMCVSLGIDSIKLYVGATCLQNIKLPHPMNLIAATPERLYTCMGSSIYTFMFAGKFVRVSKYFADDEVIDMVAQDDGIIALNSHSLTELRLTINTDLTNMEGFSSAIETFGASFENGIFKKLRQVLKSRHSSEIVPLVSEKEKIQRFRDTEKRNLISFLRTEAERIFAETVSVEQQTSIDMSEEAKKTELEFSTNIRNGIKHKIDIRKRLISHLDNETIDLFHNFEKRISSVMSNKTIELDSTTLTLELNIEILNESLKEFKKEIELNFFQKVKSLDISSPNSSIKKSSGIEKIDLAISRNDLETAFTIALEKRNLKIIKYVCNSFNHLKGPFHLSEILLFSLIQQITSSLPSKYGPPWLLKLINEIDLQKMNNFPFRRLLSACGNKILQIKSPFRTTQNSEIYSELIALIADLIA